MSDPLGLVGGSGGVQDPRLNKAGGANAQEDANGASFKETLLQNIERVNELQQDAEQAIEDLSAGRRDDMANVMIAKQKSDMAFKMLLQVRNKMMDAYDEVKRLRV